MSVSVDSRYRVRRRAADSGTSEVPFQAEYGHCRRLGLIGLSRAETTGNKTNVQVYFAAFSDKAKVLIWHWALQVALQQSDGQRAEARKPAGAGIFCVLQICYSKTRTPCWIRLLPLIPSPELLGGLWSHSKFQ